MGICILLRPAIYTYTACINKIYTIHTIHYAYIHTAKYTWREANCNLTPPSSGSKGQMHKGEIGHVNMIKKGK